MRHGATRVGLIVLAAMLVLAPGAHAQGLDWGVKAGVHSTSLAGVSDYYRLAALLPPVVPGREG